MDKQNTELYEITGAYAEVSAQLMECETEEEFEEALKVFNAIETDMIETAEQKARILRNLQLRAAERRTLEDGFKAEAKRLEQKRKAAENAAERLKESVLFAMETAGMERIRTGIGTWYIGSSVRVEVLDANEVPAEFIKGYTPEVDKTAVKKHFEFTGEIPGGLDIIQGRTARFR